MTWRGLRVPLLAIVALAALVAGSYWLTRPPEEPPNRSALADPTAASVERGKRLFWSRARCSLCHQVGSRGGARRGPPLSEGEAGPAIGARAVTRALERAQTTGLPYTAADYLVESLLEPGAFIVPGYRNEMPPVRTGPPPLSDEEIRALITYLESLGGSANPDAVRLDHSTR